MRYVGYVACMVKGFVESFCSGCPNGKTPFRIPRHRRVDNIKKHIQEAWWRTTIGQRRVAVYSKHDEYLGSIKCAEFVDYPMNYLLLKKVSTPCICEGKNQLHAFFTLIYRDLRSTKHKIYSMQLRSQLATYHMTFSFLSLYYWRSPVPVYTQSHNTHHAFLHITKYFFKSLYYNSGTLTARSCRIFSKCYKMADKNLT